MDFLKKYEEDKSSISKVIGVHFVSNNNLNAPDTIGIEIEIIKNNNVAIVQSVSDRRYRVKSYNELSNYCIAEEYQDQEKFYLFPQDGSQSKVVLEESSKYKDLLMSELYELKNMWFLYNKKINNLLVILP
jgi:hypothetical protein